jgi:hypothetical protein
MLKMNVKELFFDRAKVLAAVDDATRRQLIKAGSFVRRSARQSMRKRKKASEPGQPPRVDSGELKKFLFFAYEPAKKTVVVGPVQLGKSIAPSVLEFGGSYQNSQGKLIPETPLRLTKNGKVALRRIKGQVKIEPRPFMGPALDKNRDKIPQFFAGSIKGGG